MDEKVNSWWMTLVMIPPSIFLFTLPFAHTNAVRYISLVLSFAVAIGFAVRNGSVNFPLKAPILVWAGFSIISLLWAVDFSYSLHEIKVEVLYAVICFWIFYMISTDNNAFHTLIFAVMVGLVANLTLTIFVNLVYGNLHVDGYHNKVGYLSTYLNTVLPIIIMLFWRAYYIGRHMSVYVLLFMVLLYAGWISENLSFLGVTEGQILTAMFMFIVFLWKTSVLNKVIVFTVTVFVTLLILNASIINNPRMQSYVENDSNPIAGDGFSGVVTRHTATGDNRLKVWVAALEKVEDSLLSGVGFGRNSFHKAYPEINEKYSGPFLHTHNLIINYAIQMGIPGVLALLYLFGMIFWNYLKFILYESDYRLHIVGVSGVVLVVGVGLKSMFDDFFVDHLSLLFWAYNGMLFGYASSIKSNSRISEAVTPPHTSTRNNESSPVTL